MQHLAVALLAIAACANGPDPHASSTCDGWSTIQGFETLGSTCEAACIAPPPSYFTSGAPAVAACATASNPNTAPAFAVTDQCATHSFEWNGVLGCCAVGPSLVNGTLGPDEPMFYECDAQ